MHSAAQASYCTGIVMSCHGVCNNAKILLKDAAERSEELRYHSCRSVSQLVVLEVVSGISVNVNPVHNPRIQY